MRALAIPTLASQLRPHRLLLDMSQQSFAELSPRGAAALRRQAQQSSNNSVLQQLKDLCMHRARWHSLLE